MSVEPEVPYADVLIVDDDAAVRTSLVDVVRSEGYQVIEAADGFAALELLDTTSIGVVLLDIRMPGLDGFQMLRMHAGAPRVVVVSADHHDAMTAPEGTDVFMFLRKPVPPPELLAVIAQALAEPNGPPA
ncbi:MAG TPA: response regulator [Acidimicrobiales bacterium]|nr:response regulator [Acidimicrobiales bacterium]